MPTDYRALHNQYAQGLAQPGTVQPNSQPGFNFLQGWTASPHAGYLPPRQAQQMPIQYGTPSTGGYTGMGGPQAAPFDPKSLLHNGIKGDYAAYMRNQRMQPQQPQQPYNTGIVPQAYQEQYMPQPTYGKPIQIDQTNPGRDPNLPPLGNGWGG